LARARAVQRFLAGQSIDVIAQESRIGRRYIELWSDAIQQAGLYVGLDPSDCFALATYKIHGALKRQEDERLPYVFLILSVPEAPRSLIEASIADDPAWLAAISDRATEEAIRDRLLSEPWAEEIRAQVRQSEFRAISARKADKLLREKLFERVHALRLRGFNRLFRGAEIDMHLSLSSEMISFGDFLRILGEHGVPGLSVRLERGEL
jgi:hypothetical protein